jgi:hypothetical protein
MAKLRQDMGRDDPDLTSAHDAAMFWLNDWVRTKLVADVYSDVDAWVYACNVGHVPPQWSPGSLQEIENLVEEKCPPVNEPLLTRVEWEFPLANGQLFLDMAATVEWLIPRLRTNPSALGYCWEQHHVIDQHGFEVKPRVMSIGQVLRQLKIYRLNFDGRIWLVAPKNEELRKILNAEGFGFLVLPQK